VTYAIPDATHNPSQDTYALAALRARDGLPLWRIPATPSTEIITAADGVLIVEGLPNGYLTAPVVGLRASDGAILWRAALPIGAGFGAAPGAVPGNLGEFGSLVSQAAPGGVLYAIDDDSANLIEGAVFAFQVTDGRILWRTAIPGLRGVLPVVDGATVYVTGADGSVVALRADTGAIRWTTSLRTAASPIEWFAPLGSFGGELYLMAYEATGGGPAVVRLNAADGANDGVALYLNGDSSALYPMFTGDIFTTLDYSMGGPPGTAAPSAMLTGWRLSGASDGFPHPLWSVPEPFDDTIAIVPTAHDAQAFYIELAGTTSPATADMIIAYRLTDGAILWRRQVLATEDTRSALGTGTPLVAGSGDLFETASGIDDVCRTPLLHQAPQVRALAGATGAVVWMRDLDATL
jgi:outer membrane protein assembly factor BamB